ncbi:hypothetical protein K435DRAFT_800121 [Dendrothele bispora CBS 962.96]|uniref:C2H2-type domain-containing protein n=1 Tax=Dendrothele bispora (strain CBS 962.96) TaxID=1314807 RepID=A0A4S8LU53_DENBC|nr:hypothetical protein K435DRAFT_800121 [Dendrothele bispora CBS 962.96]
MSSNTHPHHRDFEEIHSHTDIPSVLVVEGCGTSLQCTAQDVYLTSPLKFDSLGHYPGWPPLPDMEELYLDSTQDYLNPTTVYGGMAPPIRNLSLQIPEVLPPTSNMNSQALASSAVALSWDSSNTASPSTSNSFTSGTSLHTPASPFLPQSLPSHCGFVSEKDEMTLQLKNPSHDGSTKWNSGSALYSWEPQSDDGITQPFSESVHGVVQNGSIHHGQVACKIEDTYNVSNFQNNQGPFPPIHFPGDMMSNSDQEANGSMESHLEIKRRNIATDRVVNHAHSRRKNPPRFSCHVPECLGRTFTTPHNYRNHMNSHKGIKPHKCRLCHYESGTQHTLLRHMKAKHPES